MKSNKVGSYYILDNDYTITCVLDSVPQVDYGDIWWEFAPCNFNTCYNTAGRQWKNLSNPDTDLSLDYDFYYKSEGNSKLVLNLKATQTGIFRCIAKNEVGTSSEVETFRISGKQIY